MTSVIPAPTAPDAVVDVRDKPKTPVSAPAPRSVSARRIAGKVFLALGFVLALFLVFEFAVTNLMYDRSQALLQKDLQALVASREATSLDWVPQQGQPVGVLTIPKIGLSSVIVQGSSASMTEQGPGHLRGTPMPGRLGNSVILGRRATYGAPFENLDQLLPGDPLTVATGAGEFTYLVQNVSIVRPGDPDVVGPSYDSRLTLITSSPKYLATGRYVVTAVLKGLPAPQPTMAAVAVAPTELGIQGEPSAIGGVLLWAELAVIAVITGVWLRRRVSRRVAWLLTAPLALALIWAAFTAADRLLPSTV